MTRAIAVLVVAAVCAALLGVDVSVSAAQDDAAREARQRTIASRVSKIGVGSGVKIERTDGRKIEGVLTAKAPDSITVDIYERRAFRRPRRVSTETISLDDVKEIKKPLSRAQVALITTGVVVGSCAALAVIASSNLDLRSPQTAPSATGEPTPDAFETTGSPTNDRGTPVSAP